jgi:hypothetical protein
MAAEMKDSMQKGTTVRVINIDKAEVLNRLKHLKAKAHPRYISKSVTFEVSAGNTDYLNESEKKRSMWMKISEDNGRTIIVLRHVPSSKQMPKKHTINASDFLTAVRISKLILHGIDYSYLEIKREPYSADGCTITIVERPCLKPEVEISSLTKAMAMKMYRKLGIKGEIGLGVNVPESVYYKLMGFDFEMVKNHYNKKLDRLLNE